MGQEGQTGDELDHCSASRSDPVNRDPGSLRAAVIEKMTRGGHYV